jgi:hypothetical protein
MRGEGDCYEAAAKLLYAHRSCPGIVLVHGTVTGQGPIAGSATGMLGSRSVMWCLIRATDA